MNQKKAKALRRQETTTKAELQPYSLIQDVVGGFTLKIDLNGLPGPERVWSADAVLVSEYPLHRSTYLYFIGCGPLMNDVRGLVRVRMPTQALRSFVEQDGGGMRALKALHADLDLTRLWMPTLADLSKVGDDRILAIEGDLLRWAANQDSGLIDVYRSPPDSITRLQRGQDPGIIGQIRLDFPAIVMVHLLVQLEAVLGVVK